MSGAHAAAAADSPLDPSQLTFLTQNVTPEEVAGTLPSRNASINDNKDGIYVIVVLQPKPEWVKVAQLQR